VTNPTTPTDLPWMLDDLVEVPNVMSQDLAEILAAGASSMYSVAAGTGRRFESGPVHQVVIEYGGRTLFIAAAGQNARLAVLCEEDVDMGLVAYEVSRLVTRIGEYLGTGARAAAHDI
jgi:predicted regulator of Ras-like GTPase activity (Roadblock/LC7/MglB family)